jgi:hypothetical protein
LGFWLTFGIADCHLSDKGGKSRIGVQRIEFRIRADAILNFSSQTVIDGIAQRS